MLKKFIKDILVYGSGDFIFKIIAFGLFFIYARLLSVEDFGILNLVFTIVGLLNMVTNFGLNNALARYYYDNSIVEQKRPLLASTGFYMLAILATLCTLLVITVGFPLRTIIFEKYQITFFLLFIALIGNIPALLIQYALDVIRMHFTPIRFTIVSFLRSLVGAIIAVLLIAYAKMGIEGYFLGICIGLGLTLPISLWFMRKDFVLGFDKGYAKTLFNYGYPFILANVAYWLLSSVDRWMLIELSNSTQLGLYSIGFKVTQIITFISGAFAQAWSPYSIKLYAENPNYKTIVGNIYTYLNLFLVIIAIGLSLFSLEILMITTPQEYWLAAESLSVLSFGLAFQGITQLSVYGIALEKKTMLISIGSWLTAIINVVANYFFIKQWGSLGAATATTLSFLFMNLFYIFYTQKLHPIELERRKLLIIFASVLIIIPLSIYLNTVDWSFIILSGKVILFTLIVILLFVTKVINLGDIKKLKLS